MLMNNYRRNSTFNTVISYSATLVNLRQREPFQFGQDDLGDANFYLK